MFRTIVGALVLVEIGIPIICGIVGCLFDEDTNIGCRIFAIAIILLIIIIV